MKVFIVEDSDVVRMHLQSMLADIPGVELAGYAVDELGAIERISKLLPDVVTLDLSLQTGSGLVVLEYIKKHHAAIKVIVLTNYVDQFYTDNCKRSGADCVFDKTFQFTRVRSVLWSWIHAAHSDNKVAALCGTGK